MKIVCTKSNLAKGVSIVSKAVPSKTTMPILECILIDASTDVVKLTANDMELGIETTIARHHRSERQDLFRDRKKTSRQRCCNRDRE